MGLGKTLQMISFFAFLKTVRLNPLPTLPKHGYLLILDSGTNGDSSHSETQ